jgi:prepilin-type N-terminal cleavage/methylation domain-containing protein
MRRKIPGFTLIEVMIVVAIVGILAALTLQYGWSARQASSFASAAWELSLRASALRARAMSSNKDFLLVVVDAVDPQACRTDQRKCGKALVFSSPTAAFALSGFATDPPYVNASFEEEFQLPRNSQLDLTSTWRAPAPFASVVAMDSELMATCANGKKCFAIRYRLDGEIEPVVPTPPLSATRAGFAFVLKPVFAESGAAERRGVFVSFPTGIVKTAVF